uniref:Uncharacterized protein n=1 Tax=Arundo donax TaxID=35708 RepID=A0A0A9E731_ARUDO
MPMLLLLLIFPWPSGTRMIHMKWAEITALFLVGILNLSVHLLMESPYSMGRMFEGYSMGAMV